MRDCSSERGKAKGTFIVVLEIFVIHIYNLRQIQLLLLLSFPKTFIFLSIVQHGFQSDECEVTSFHASVYPDM